MAIHQIPLRMKINGKVTSGRIKREFLVSQTVSVSVPEVSDHEIQNAIIVTMGDYTEKLKVFDGRIYIKDAVNNLLAAELRAKTFLISDYHVARALMNGSTFEVLHFYDSKLLQQDLEPVPDDLRQSNYKEVYEAEYGRLQIEANKKLIDVDGDLYLEAGDPVVCLRLISGNLQVFFGCRNTEFVKTTVPTIMIPLKKSETEPVDLNALIDLYESETNKKASVLSEASLMDTVIRKFDYSARKAIVSEAKIRVNDDNLNKEWASEQFAAWKRLSDTLESYSKDKQNTNVDELSEALQAYAHFENDDIALYTKMLNLLWTRERDLVDTSVDVIDLSDIDIDSLDRSQFPHITLD